MKNWVDLEPMVAVLKDAYTGQINPVAYITIIRLGIGILR